MIQAITAFPTAFLCKDSAGDRKTLCSALSVQSTCLRCGAQLASAYELGGAVGASLSGPAPSHCPSTARPRPFAAIRLTFRCSSVSISLHFIDTPLPIRDRSLPFLDLSLQFRNRFAALPPRPPPGMMVDSLFARDAGKAAGDSTACSCHCCLPMLLQLQLVLLLLVLATADAAVPATADAAVPAAAAAAAACCCCLLLLLAAATVVIIYAC